MQADSFHVHLYRQLQLTEDDRSRLAVSQQLQKRLGGMVDLVVLGFCGANPPEGFWVPLSQVATVYYFLHFLILLPLIGWFERPRPLPDSIAKPVLKA